MTPGHAIMLYRTQHALKLETIAAHAGFPVDVLRDIEEDKRRVDGGEIYNIANAMNVSVFTLLSLPSQSCDNEKDARSILRPHLWRLAKERGERLRSRREGLGLTKKYVANSVNKPASLILDHEHGTIMTIPYELLQALAEVLECTPDWILGNEDVDSSKDKEITSLNGTRSNTNHKITPYVGDDEVMCSLLFDEIRQQGKEAEFQERYGSEAWVRLQTGTLRFTPQAAQDMEKWLGVD